MEEYCTEEKNRGRTEKRTVKIYESNLDTHNQQKWGSIKTLIKVEREIIFKGKLNQETAYLFLIIRVKSELNIFIKASVRIGRLKLFIILRTKLF